MTTWTPVSESLPVSVATVLILCPREDEPVWLGYYDGSEWRDVSGAPVVVTHWADMPEPPAPSLVFIDPLMTCLVSKSWKWPKACHMFVESPTDLQVLHDFAARIGLKREWFQNDRWPHYDLNPSRREKALRAGAIPLARRDAVHIMRAWKKLKIDAAADRFSFSQCNQDIPSLTGKREEVRDTN